jgi:hypothetical protein
MPVVILNTAIHYRPAISSTRSGKKTASPRNIDSCATAPTESQTIAQSSRYAPVASAVEEHPAKRRNKRPLDREAVQGAAI